MTTNELAKEKQNALVIMLAKLSLSSYRFFSRIVPEGRARWLISSIARRILKYSGNLISQEMIFGYRTIVKYGNQELIVRPLVVFDNLIASPSFEWRQFKYFKPVQGDVVIDIGAHIGAYTLKASELVGAEGKVISIEPDPRNFEILEKNIQLNKLANVIALPYVISDIDGATDLYLTADPLFSSVYASRIRGDLTDKISVKSMRFDTLMRNLRLDRINWIKVDIEGAEMRFLIAASKILERAKGLKMIVEFSSNDVEPYLQSLGFKTEIIEINYLYCEKE